MVYHPLSKPAAEWTSSWPEDYSLGVIIKSSIFNDRSGGEGFLSHERDTVLGQDWLDRFVGKGYCGLLVFAVAREMYRWTLFEIEGSANLDGFGRGRWFQTKYLTASGSNAREEVVDLWQGRHSWYRVWWYAVEMIDRYIFWLKCFGMTVN